MPVLTHTEETRALISRKLANRPKSDQHRAAIAAALTGKRHSDSSRARMSESQKVHWESLSIEEQKRQIEQLRSVVPKTRSDEWRQKLSVRSKANRHVFIQMTIQRNRARALPSDTAKTRRGAIAFIRTRLHNVLRNKSNGVSLLGYTKSDLISHIESQFSDGMSWGNYGKRGGDYSWVIDHVIPIKWFLDNGCQDPVKVNALSNLRPLWKLENLKKQASLGVAVNA